MEGKPRTDTGAPQAEMQPIRLRDEDAGRPSHGLRNAVIVVVLAAVAIGTLLVVSTQEEDVVGVPDPSRWAVEEFTSALGRSDGVAAADLFVEDGVYRLTDGTAYEGKAEIERFVATLPPIDYILVGDLSGGETRVTGTFSYASAQGSGTLVREFVFVGDDLASVTDSEA